MLPVDTPTRREVLALGAIRAEPCVSLYLATTDVTREAEASRIAFANAVPDAVGQIDLALPDPRLRQGFEDAFDDLAADDGFWARQARSLAVLATVDHVWTYRLATRVEPTVQVSDRFHLRPLLRAMTTPQAGFALALSEGGARLIEVFPDMRPEEVAVPGMPRDAAGAVGKASINDRSHSQRIVGSEGKRVRLRQYARAVDEALRGIAMGDAAPLVLAANEPVAGAFRSVAGHAHLVDEGFGGEIERMTPLQLAERARPLLDARRQAGFAAMREAHERRAEQGRATMDLSTAARAAAMGAVETLMVDMDDRAPGVLDEETGAVSFAAEEGLGSYDLLDAVTLRALATGAEIAVVRSEDLAPGSRLSAALRYRL